MARSVDCGAMSFKAPFLDVDAQHHKSHMFKVGIALGVISGSCLVLLGVLGLSASSPTAGKSTSLVAMPTSLRMKPSAMPSMTIHNLPGPSPWKELALASLEDSTRCDRDISMNANFHATMARLSNADKAMVTSMASKTKEEAVELLKVGAVQPLGFFDPFGFSARLTDGALLYYREAEIKHGRVCMIAALGIVVGETYHPLFGGNIDVASTKVFTQVPIADLWPAMVLQFLVACAFEEIRTNKGNLLGTAIGGIVPNEAKSEDGVNFGAKSERLPGDLGFDPLGIKPEDENELMSIQNKEILNGRLAMIGVAGIVAQEQVTGMKIFGN